MKRSYGYNINQVSKVNDENKMINLFLRDESKHVLSKCLPASRSLLCY